MKLNDTRRRLLLAIYREMRACPKGQGLHENDARHSAGSETDFELTYLAERGLVARRAFGYLRLTPDGIDLIEGETE